MEVYGLQASSFDSAVILAKLISEVRVVCLCVRVCGCTWVCGCVGVYADVRAAGL